MNRLSLLLLAATTAICLLMAGCAEPPPYHPGRAKATPFRYRPPLPVGKGPVAVVVGDMVCAPGRRVTAKSCQDVATAKLAREYHPDHLLALGDEQYGAGGLADYRKAYAKSWGRFQAITKPVPGDQQYAVPGYFDYFRKQTRPPGYYAFDVDRWRIYAINDNCTRIDCDAELAWLESDMSANPRRCSAIMMHHPLHASGLEVEAAVARPFWRVALRHGTDLSLAGHIHDYERFRPLGLGDAPLRNGITSFVAGIGGASMRPLTEKRAQGSVAFENSSAGVLVVRFSRGRFAWQVRTIEGFNVDSGARACH